LHLPPSFLALLAAALVCGLLVVIRSAHKTEGLVMWSFSKEHLSAYVNQNKEWNADHPDQPVNIRYISEQAMTDRMMGSFFSGTASADLIEMNQGPNVNAWRGPDEATGFRDLTPLLKRDGILDDLNPPSLSPWTRQGRIYGLPHDMHPVLLCYRADILEAAGIDVTKLTTWDKFFTALAPLCQDFDGDGYRDRYALELEESITYAVSILVHQAGGELLDDYDHVHIDSPVVADVIAKLAHWSARPNQLTEDIPLLSAAAAQPLLKGRVLCWLTPDWRIANMYDTVPGLKGKVKLMPLPAWTEGGRRTSVFGGTMLGLPKITPGGRDTMESSWQFAKYLYLSKESAITLYEKTGIITPVRKYWSLPVYDQPNDYFCGQHVGRMYIDQAPNVPPRCSSPYEGQAEEELLVAFEKLKAYAEAHNPNDLDDLRGEARVLLHEAARNLQLTIDRSSFTAAHE
jgi:arabinosaccharide transport system substrate-binding protein